MDEPRDVPPMPGRRSIDTVGDRSLRVALLAYMRSRTKGSPDAEDLVHEVLLRVWNRADSRPIDNVPGYAFQTAASVLADRYRRQRSRQVQNHVEFDAERHASCGIDAGRILEDRESLRAATAILAALPQRTQTIFVLRRLEGAAYRDIATQLGLSVSAIEKHMERAVRRLADAVSH